MYKVNQKNSKNQNDKISKNQKFRVLLLLLLPILSPYGVGTSTYNVSMTDLICLMIVVYFMMIKRKLFVNKVLVNVLNTCFILTIISHLFTFSLDLNFLLSVKVFIAFLLYLIAFSSLRNQLNVELFYTIAEVFGVFCALLAIMQFIFASLGIRNFYSGILPFPLSKYSYFGGLFDKNTGAIRVHSFFEEPSYLAIYLLPIIAHCIQFKKYLKATIMILACIVSATALGIVGIFVLAVFFVLFSDLNFNHKILFILIVGLGIICLSVVYNQNIVFKGLMDYYFNRYSSINIELSRSNSSVSQRLVGNMGLFSDYNFLNKIIGVGINQYKFYFNISTDYSNDFVCMLLNFGYCGVILLIIIIGYFLKNIHKKGYVFILILSLVLLVDHIWFNNYFFYLITWIYLFKIQNVDYCFVCGTERRY